MAKGEERDGSLAFTLRSAPSTSKAEPKADEEKESSVTLDIDASSPPPIDTLSHYRLQPFLLPLTHPHSHATPHHHSRFSLSGLKALVAGRGTSFCCVLEGTERGKGGEVLRFEESQSFVVFFLSPFTR